MFNNNSFKHKGKNADNIILQAQLYSQQGDPNCLNDRRKKNIAARMSVPEVSSNFLLIVLVHVNLYSGIASYIGLSSKDSTDSKPFINIFLGNPLERSLMLKIAVQCFNLVKLKLLFLEFHSVYGSGLGLATEKYAHNLKGSQEVAVIVFVSLRSWELVHAVTYRCLILLAVGAAAGLWLLQLWPDPSFTGPRECVTLW